MMPLGLATIDVAHGRGCRFNHITEGCERLFGERPYLEKISQMSFTLGMPIVQKREFVQKVRYRRLGRIPDRFQIDAHVTMCDRAS